VLAGAKRVRQIFVHGDESHSSLVAVIVPDVEALSAWYQSHASKSASPSSSSTTPTVAEMCGDPRVYAMFEKAVRRCAKEGGLRPWEVPKILSFETEIDSNGLGFTVENGGMTTWFKLRHPHLSSKYSATIKSLYAQCPPQSRARTSVKTHEANLAAAPGAKAA
jgi:long-subunit acyl-CoA synthetase (AMP-forming)